MFIVQISDIHCGPMLNQETKKILKEEWVNKRYSYKLIQDYEPRNDRNQKSTPPTKEKGVRRKAS